MRNAKKSPSFSKITLSNGVVGQQVAPNKIVSGFVGFCSLHALASQKSSGEVDALLSRRADPASPWGSPNPSASVAPFQSGP